MNVDGLLSDYWRMRTEAIMSSDSDDFDHAAVMLLVAEVKKLRADRGWRPIEAAPRDGRTILATAPYGLVLVFWWDQAECWADAETRYARFKRPYPTPTHWTEPPPGTPFIRSAPALLCHWLGAETDQRA